MRTSLIFLFTLLLITSCATAAATPDGSEPVPEDPAQASAQLHDGQYLSTGVSVKDNDRPLVSGSQISLTLAEGRLNIRAGCNLLFGSYRVEDGFLVASPLASTRMGCQAPLLEQDQFISEFFASIPAIDRDGDSMTLSSGDTKILFAIG